MYRGGLAIGFAVTQLICALTAITFNSLAIQQRKDDYDSVDCFYGEYHLTDSYFGVWNAAMVALKAIHSQFLIK